jgi:hypothetical protein
MRTHSLVFFENLVMTLPPNDSIIAFTLPTPASTPPASGNVPVMTNDCSERASLPLAPSTPGTRTRKLPDTPGGSDDDEDETADATIAEVDMEDAVALLLLIVVASPPMMALSTTLRFFP